MFEKLWDGLVTFVDKKDLQVRRKLFRWWLKLTHNPRPTSYPYIAGDSFRAVADHIHDETISLDPNSVKCGDSVFVGQGHIPQFFDEIHPHIKHQYVLICHNGDRPQIDASIAARLDDKIVHFFAQDVLFSHEKITPIGIGLENKHFHVAGVLPLFNKLRRHLERHTPKRKDRIFFNFSENTNPAERGPAKAYFRQHPLMETAPRFLSPRRHNYLLMQYKFVASPPGNAIESCRTWEALYLKTIPICKDYPSFVSFAKKGLPVWVIHDWKELEGLTESDLAEKYDKFIREANWAPLYMDYWINLINEQKRRCQF